MDEYRLKFNMNHLIESLLLILVLTAAVAAQSPPQYKGSEENLPPAPKVKIEEAVNSPLKIIAWTKWVAEGRGIELNVKVQNVTIDKAIRAYANRFSVPGGRIDYGCIMFNVVKPGKVLQPTMSEVRTTWRAYSTDLTEPIPAAVDYVEFTDNSTWGIDSCKSAERLAGARAGGKAFVEKLLTIFQDGGPSAVLKSAQGVADELVAPLDETAIWRDGFSGGVKSVLRRIEDAVREGGLPEIEVHLKKPYDASGYQIEIVQPQNP
jgi:hypothetical protein